MENASKAILISAGVLFAIILISISILIWSNAKISVSTIEKQKKENVINEQTEKFTQYVGEIIGVNVKNCVRRVLSYNETNPNNIITVNIGESTFTTIESLKLEYNEEEASLFLTAYPGWILSNINDLDIYTGSIHLNTDGTINGIDFS